MNSVYEISLYKSFSATECVEYRGQWCAECGEDNGGCLFCYNCGVRKEIIKCGECFTIQNLNEWVNWIECQCKQSNCCPSCYCKKPNRCVKKDCMCHCRFCLKEYDESDDEIDYWTDEEEEVWGVILKDENGVVLTKSNDESDDDDSDDDDSDDDEEEEESEEE